MTLSDQIQKTIPKHLVNEVQYGFLFWNKNDFSIVLFIGKPL